MKHARVLTATIFFYFLFHPSCSQPAGSSKKTSFEATTPCNEEVKQLLGIPAGIECEMMKWDLTLYRDEKDLPSTFDLTYTYGLAKQGTRGFKEGAKTVELKGKWITKKTSILNIDKNVIILTPTNTSIGINFLQPGDGILHLLTQNGNPMVGDAAWSFTLNNKNPVVSSSGSIVSKELTTTGIISNTDTVAVFVGRTPCHASLRKLNTISAEGCNLIKCKLILLQDQKTQSPANFIIQTIYVGKGDNRYTVTGKWKVMQGMAGDPKAILYQLLPDLPQAENELRLLKAGDNLLFFIDGNSQLLVGNDYCSYTLNRAN